MPRDESLLVLTPAPSMSSSPGSDSGFSGVTHRAPSSPLDAFVRNLTMAHCPHGPFELVMDNAKLPSAMLLPRNQLKLRHSGSLRWEPLQPQSMEIPKRKISDPSVIAAQQSRTTPPKNRSSFTLARQLPDFDRFEVDASDSEVDNDVQMSLPIRKGSLQSQDSEVPPLPIRKSSMVSSPPPLPTRKASVV